MQILLTVSFFYQCSVHANNFHENGKCLKTTNEINSFTLTLPLHCRNKVFFLLFLIKNFYEFG